MLIETPWIKIVNNIIIISIIITCRPIITSNDNDSETTYQWLFGGEHLYPNETDTILSNNNDHIRMLHYAIEKNNGVRVVDFLLTLYPNIQHHYVKGKNALHVAASCGNIEAIDMLIRYGSDINNRSQEQRAPLMYGIQSENVATVETLLFHKADPNIIDTNGTTPLMNGLTLQNVYNRLAITDLLIHAKANINHKDFSNTNSFYYALKINDADLIDFLLEYHYKPNEQIQIGLRPVHIVAEEKNSAIMDILLKHRANPNIKDFNGKTPLIIVASKQDQKNDIARLLIDAKATTTFHDRYGKTALDYARKNNNIGLIELLHHQD